MRSIVIMNPAAGSAASSGPLHDRLAAIPDLTVRQTCAVGQARAVAREAVREGYELVIAAGGDGTINEVVQGLATDLERATLGVLPLGTGNDLARSLGMPFNPIEALEILTNGAPERERKIDLIRVDTVHDPMYCVNIAAGGFSGQVDEVLTEAMKATWGPLSYVGAAARVLPDLTGYTTSIAYDGGEPEEFLAFNVIVANGRTCGGGKRVAPTADLEDGLLDVIVVRYASLLDLAAVAARLIAGVYLDSPDVFHRRATSVRVSSTPGMWFNVDGELLTKEPATFTVVPRGLRVITGPGYSAPEP